MAKKENICGKTEAGPELIVPGGLTRNRKYFSRKCYVSEINYSIAFTATKLYQASSQMLVCVWVASMIFVSTQYTV